MFSLNYLWTRGDDYYFSDEGLDVYGDVNALQGDDEIHISHENLFTGLQFASSSSLVMGDGDDSIQINSLDGNAGIIFGEGNVISMGNGNDTILVNGLWYSGVIAYGGTNRASIDLGSGDNLFTASATSNPITFGSVDFFGGDGSDRINAIILSPEITYGDSFSTLHTNVFLGSGNDQIVALNGELDIHFSYLSMGDGDDVLSTNSRLWVQDSEIDMGDGDDIVEGGGYLDSNSSVYLGKGNDIFKGLTNAPIQSDKRGAIFGGEGRDTLEIQHPGEYVIELDDQHYWLVSRPGYKASFMDFELLSSSTGDTLDFLQGVYTLDEQGGLTYEPFDLNGDGFVDEVTNYQMWTASGGVDLTNRRGRTYSDDTSRKWDAIKAVQVDGGFSVLIEGHRNKEGKHKVASANEEGVINGATRWLNGNQMLDEGYEDLFAMDFNGNSQIGF